ncbi:hypothetical protein M231_08088 [Tremella mesenterica]|uniref:Uncharacterized protein n=1 Tax=Tremella mesenterica TaxID=5217 RepID=A0A4Q1BAK7_TREME|nr:hypothetical protein M231_08088 [Tremella mesenterica]
MPTPKKLPPLLSHDRVNNLRESFLPEVIIVRAAAFDKEDEPARSKDNVVAHENASVYFVRRSEIARFIIDDCLTGDIWVNKAPVVGYRERFFLHAHDPAELCHRNSDMKYSVKNQKWSSDKTKYPLHLQEAPASHTASSTFFRFRTCTAFLGLPVYTVSSAIPISHYQSSADKPMVIAAAVFSTLVGNEKWRTKFLPDLDQELIKEIWVRLKTSGGMRELTILVSEVDNWPHDCLKEAQTAIKKVILFLEDMPGDELKAGERTETLNLIRHGFG